MNRKRQILIGAALISSLVCAVAVSLWALGYSKSYWAGRQTPHALYEIGVSRGELYVHARRAPRAGDVESEARVAWLWQTGPADDILRELEELVDRGHGPTAGFFHYHFDAYGESETWLALPMVFLIVLFAGLPILTVKLRLRRGQRAAVGCCTACGYDLRATPGRCPECGLTCKSG